jgi:hypothetical protein
VDYSNHFTKITHINQKIMRLLLAILSLKSRIHVISHPSGQAETPSWTVVRLVAESFPDYHPYRALTRLFHRRASCDIRSITIAERLAGARRDPDDVTACFKCVSSSQPGFTIRSCIHGIRRIIQTNPFNQ